MTPIHVLDFQVLTSFLLHCESLVYVKSFIHPNCVLCMVWYDFYFLVMILLPLDSAERVASFIQGLMFPSGGVFTSSK